MRGKGHTRLCSPDPSGDHLVAITGPLLRTAPTCPIRPRRFALSHAITGMSQHIPGHHAGLLLYAGFPNVPSQMRWQVRATGS